MPKIVVSYRRADTGPVAGRIFDRLGTQYGFDSVFMDVDNIPFGVDFREHIQEELSQCDLLVVIIGPRWLGVGEDGKTRLNDETDPVRIEVETAMRARVPIIPILVDNTTMPKPAELPDSLREFAFRNAAQVDAAGRDFRQHMDRIIRSIDQILARKSAPADPVSPPAQSVGPAAGVAPVRPPQPAPVAAAAPEPGPAQATRSGASSRNWAIGVGLVVLLGIGAGVTVTTYLREQPARPAPAPPATPPPVAATDYPIRPVTTIVPFAPGGGTVFVARLVGEHLSTKAGQVFIVENRAGGGGTIGMQMVVNSAPDGYTISVASLTDFLNRSLIKNLAYDPLRDLIPAAMIGRGPAVVVVNPALPAKTLRELIAYAKANPGKISYGSGGIGTTNHIGAAQFARVAGLNLVHAPYPGMGPATADLLSGKISMMHMPLTTAQTHIKAGKLRALAIVAQERWLEHLPDVPTTVEAGLTGYDFETWYGLVAPQGTPRPVIEKLNLLTRQVIADATLRKRLTDIYLRPTAITSDEFAASLNRDVPKLEALIKELGL